MKIYTKKGDNGTTSLLRGERVSKDDIRLEALGTLDELISYLGLIRDLSEDAAMADSLLRIQKDLMTLSVPVAGGDEDRKAPALAEEEILFLEKEIDRMNETLPPLRRFILPGGDILASHCHIARTICRRVERRMVVLLKSDLSPGRTVQFLNRLSDYLFVLARSVTDRRNRTETYW